MPPSFQNQIANSNLQATNINPDHQLSLIQAAWNLDNYEPAFYSSIFGQAKSLSKAYKKKSLMQLDLTRAHHLNGQRSVHRETTTSRRYYSSKHSSIESQSNV